MHMNQYLTVKEVSELYKMTERAIRKKIQKGEFSDIKENKSTLGRGGKSYLIALSCLPAAMIDLYNGNHPETPKKDFRLFTNKQRDEAFFKRNIVQEYERFESTDNGSKKVERFVKAFNCEHPDRHITPGQLYDWKKRWNKNNDFVDLIDTRGGMNKGDTVIPEEAWEYFYALYMDQRKRSVQLCYDRTCDKYRVEGEAFPSYHAFKRKADSIPDAYIIKYRYGDEAAKNGVMPYIVRDPSNLETNECWQSDHKLMDVFVRDEDNRPCRLWLTSWIDIRSRKVIGAYLRHGDPNTDTVLHTLHMGIKNTGYKPLQLYTDNGKDYKAKRGVNPDVPDSVSNQLGIKKVIRAIKYNGQAKLIERYHRTIDDRFAKLYPTYAGKDAKYRPEDLEKGLIPIEEYPTIQEFETEFFNWLEDDYHNRKHHGKGMGGHTPNEIYAANLPDREQADMEEINYIFLKKTKRKVQQNGVTVHKLDFWNEKLIPYIGQPVMVLTEYNDIQHVEIEDMDGNYICSAGANPVYIYGEDLGQYEEVNRRRKKARANMRKEKPKTEINVHEEILEKNTKTRLQEIAHEKNAKMIDRNGIPQSDTDSKVGAEQGIDSQTISNMLEYLQHRKAIGD